MCWYPYTCIFIDVLPCTMMFLCEIRAIKISYSYSYMHTGMHHVYFYIKFLEVNNFSLLVHTIIWLSEADGNIINFSRSFKSWKCSIFLLSYQTVFSVRTRATYIWQKKMHVIFNGVTQYTQNKDVLKLQSLVLYIFSTQFQVYVNWYEVVS